MSSHLITSLTILSLSVAGVVRAQEHPAKTIRAGMIGLDTSHVPAFTRIFHNPQATGDLAGIKIVAGYPGGTDIPASLDRVAGFTEQLRGMGVEIVETIPELLKRVDVVLLESVDGRIHLQEATPVLQAGKPLWIDKPVAGSLADAKGQSPVSAEEAIEIFAFMEAADESKRQGGATVSLATVLDKAKAEAAARLPK